MSNDQFDLTKNQSNLPATQQWREQNSTFQLTPLINLYKASAFKNGFGQNQKNYETFAKKFCKYIIDKGLPITQTSLDLFLGEFLKISQGKSKGYFGKVKSYLNKFFKFCQENKISYVLPDPAKRQEISSEMIATYLSFTGVRGRSQNAYRNALNHFFKFLDGGDLNFNYESVTAYLSMLAKELSPHTISFRISCLKNFTKFMIDEHKNLRIPEENLFALRAIDKIKTPRLGSKKYYKDPLSTEEVARLLNIAITPSPIYRAMWSLMVHSGLRVKEVQALTLYDVDFDNNTINVIGKGRDGKELVRLFQATKTHLLFYISGEGAYISPKDLLFPGFQKESGYAKIWKSFRMSLAKMGLSPLEQLEQKRKISLHSLRHTCAQRMHDSGNPLEVIQMQLRHTQTESTMVYTNKTIREKFMKKIIE